MKLPFLALAPMLVLAACGQPVETHVEHGWVRLAAVPSRPAAAYFDLKGGKTDTTLLSVTSPVAIKTEMHETMRQGAGMSMAPLQQVSLPAKGTVPFAPGGKHVMIFDVNPSIKPGKTMPLIFTFSDGLRIEFDAPVIAAGDTPPH